MEPALDGELVSPFGSEYPIHRVCGLLFSGRRLAWNELKPAYTFRGRLIGIAVCNLLGAALGIASTKLGPASLQGILQNAAWVAQFMAFHFFFGGIRPNFIEQQSAMSQQDDTFVEESPRDGLHMARLIYTPSFWVPQLKDEGWVWVEDNRLLFRGYITCMALSRESIGLLYPDGERVSLHIESKEGKKLGKVRIDIITPTANPYKRSYALFTAIRDTKRCGLQAILPSRETSKPLNAKNIREDVLATLLVGLSMGTYTIFGDNSSTGQSSTLEHKVQSVLIWVGICVGMTILAHGYRRLCQPPQRRQSPESKEPGSVH